MNAPSKLTRITVKAKSQATATTLLAWMDQGDYQVWPQPETVATFVVVATPRDLVELLIMASASGLCSDAACLTAALDLLTWMT